MGHIASRIREFLTRPPRRIPVGAAVVAALFFGPNLAVAILGESPERLLAVDAGYLLACGLTAFSFVIRGRREPAARTGWGLVALGVATVGIASLEHVIVALAQQPRPAYPSAGDWASLVAFPLGGVGLLWLPVRAESPGKSIRLGLDSVLFATSTLFIAFTLSFSSNARLRDAAPQFRQCALLNVILLIANLAMVLYVVRNDLSCLTGPLGLLMAGLAAAIVPALLALRLFGSEASYASAHPDAVFYSAALYVLWLAARWRGGLCGGPVPRGRFVNPAAALTFLAYLPYALNIVIGFRVISGNRPLLWSGFASFFLIMSRLLLALFDYRKLSRTLQERVRQRTEQLEASQAHLARAERLDALGRLAGGVAHDFNNLLTTIIGNAQLLSERQAGEDRRQQFLVEIARACNRGASLTRQLLTFARKQPRSLRVFSAAAQVRDMQGLLSRIITENIRLTARYSPESTRIKMDPHQLEQVVMNLTLNARDAMPEGGSLLLEVGNVLVTDEQASRQPNAKAGPHVRLRVRDSGVGIAKDVMNRIFDPFFTTKGQGRGTGLGLAICYGIVKEAEGFLEVESEVGRGTTFDVFLPESFEAYDEPSAVQAIAPSSKCHGMILLAEDEPAVRRLLVEVLGSAGYQTLVAEDGSQAARLARSHGGRIDLFLTDLVMPEMGGLAAAEQVTAVHPEAKVLVMSGYAEDESASQRLSSSQIPFLPKPVSPGTLLNRIRDLIAN